MNDPVQKPTARSKGLLALRASVIFTAWLLFLIIPLSLGTLLPPFSGKLNLSGCFIISIVLTMLFRAWLPVRKEGDAKKGAVKVLAALLALLAVCYAAVSAVSAHWRRETDAARLGLQKRGFQVSLSGFQDKAAGGEYLSPALARSIATGFAPVFNKNAAAQAALHVYGGIEAWNRETAKKEAAYSALFGPYLEKELAPLLKKKYAGYAKVDYAQAAREPLGDTARRLDNIPSVIKISEIAKLRAVSLALGGDAEKAWGLVRLQFSLAEVFAGENSLLGKLVTLALRGQALDASAGILLNNAAAVIPGDVALSLRGASSGALASEGLRAELAYQYDIFDFLRRMDFRQFRKIGGLSAMPGSAGGGEFKALLDYGLFSLLRGTGLYDLNFLVTAGYFETILRPGAWAQVSARSAQAEARISGLPAWPYFMARAEAPSFGRLFAKELDIQVRARLALACARLRGWRRAHGKYPGKLPELKLKEEGMDVYSGGELVYEPAAGGKGFDLCSAGPAGDRKDVSGVELCLHQR